MPKMIDLEQGWRRKDETLRGNFDGRTEGAKLARLWPRKPRKIERYELYSEPVVEAEAEDDTSTVGDAVVARELLELAVA